MVLFKVFNFKKCNNERFSAMEDLAGMREMLMQYYGNVNTDI